MKFVMDHRLLREEWYAWPDYSRLFFHLLLKARDEDGDIEAEGVIIPLKRGQLIGGRKLLSQETSIPEGSIWRILQYFQREQVIEQVSLEKFSIITVTYSMSDEDREQVREHKYININPKLSLSSPEEDLNLTTDLYFVKPSVSRVPYQEILNLYHELLPMGRRVVKLTETRKKHIRARWKNELKTLEHWRNYFSHAAASAWLTGKIPGRDNRPFEVDIDFLINPQNLVKIAEGKYHR